MKALVLAGGIGSRLKLEDLPKPMYKLNGNPILEHNLLLLKKHNITDICITIHHLPEVIKNYFGDGNKWNLKIQYSFEEELVGTAGSVKKAEWFFDKDPFFVIYGDNYTNINLSKMLEFHSLYNPLATIALYNPEKSLNCRIAGGVVKIDSTNSITSFVEGNNSTPNNINFVNAGVYILKPEFLKKLKPNTFYDFGKDLFPSLLKEGTVLKGYLTDDFVIAIDTKEALIVAEKILSNIKD